MGDSIHTEPVTAGEVHDVIKSMKNKATMDIKVSSIKVANDSRTFTQVLARVISSSFEQGVFPSSMKVARVIPVFKNNGSKTDASNYRPISLLSSISKIYEKLMHTRIVNFMEGNQSI